MYGAWIQFPIDLEEVYLFMAVKVGGGEILSSNVVRKERKKSSHKDKLLDDYVIKFGWYFLFLWYNINKYSLYYNMDEVMGGTKAKATLG